jgi:hypothetical protein
MEERGGVIGEGGTNLHREREKEEEGGDREGVGVRV